MSILGAIGSLGNYALQAYGAYGAVQTAKSAMRPARGAGGRLLTGAVAGAAGYLAGGEGGPRRRRHAKGISGAELRGFNKTCRLLSKVGMVPRKLKGSSIKAKKRSC